MAAASASTSPAAPTEPDYLQGFEEALQKESRKATFTCAGLQTPHDERLLQDLIAACHPATFGRGGQDIYDSTYRRAGALGPADFLTDFCPYETGILDIVTQLLLPPRVGDLETQAPISEEGKEFGPYGGGGGGRGEEIARRVEGPETPSDVVVARRAGIPAQLGPLFEELDVPFVDEDEAERIEDALDPERTGCVFEEDVFAVAAERLIARRDAMQRTTTVEDPPPPFHSKTRRMLCRGLRAELYKLNVYSGPGGVFNPHVDTPRSASQIASLVVCLPVEFEGGELAVRHLGQEIVHDWGKKNYHNTPAAAAAAAATPPPPPRTTPAINWTAFYSDCAHEVRPIHTGHRLTLTYNLYLSPGTGLLNTPPLLLRRLLPHALPLVPHLHHALANPGFKPKGGHLAFWLRHRYPHTQPVGCEFVVEMLK
ncbi:hypothetical protein KC334_g10841, partial [Hortaea werneckii]